MLQQSNAAHSKASLCMYTNNASLNMEQNDTHPTFAHATRPEHVARERYITVHSRSGRFFSLCLPFSTPFKGSLLLLLNRSFFSFLLLLRETPLSFLSLAPS